MKKLLIVLCVLAPAWVLTLLLPGSASTPAQAVPTAGQSFFLEADGFQGESTDAKHDKQIDVLAWSWGASNADGRTPRFQDISLTKYIDRTSPKLLEFAAGGDTIAWAKLHVIKAGELQQEYLTLCFTNLHVTSVANGGSAGEDRLTENITLSYETILQQYRPQSADGKLEAPINGSWNLTKNQKGSASCTTTPSP